MIEPNQTKDDTVQDYFKIFNAKKDILKLFIGILILSDRTLYCEKNFRLICLNWLKSIYVKFEKKRKKKKILCLKKIHSNPNLVFKFLLFLYNTILGTKTDSGILDTIQYSSEKKSKIKKVHSKKNENHLRHSIQASINILKQEIKKIGEIDQKLGFFETGMNSVSSIHSKISARITALQKQQTNLSWKHKNLSNIMHLLTIVALLFFFTIPFMLQF